MIISSNQLAKQINHPYIKIGGHTISTSVSARSLGVVIDNNLSMNTHITTVCKSAFYHLRNISRIRRYLDRDTLEYLVHAFISSKLDYCNSILCGVSSSHLSRLQSIQNAAARILTGTSKYDHITPVLQHLHWLPVKQRIKFKMMVLIYKSLNNTAPRYLSDLIQPYVPIRSLRSGDKDLLHVPFTKSQLVKQRAFSVAGPGL